MFRHIVLFKFKPEYREEAVVKAAENLRSLKDKIDFIRSMEIGVDDLHRPISCDLALTLTFDSKEDYLRYDQHPEHVAIKGYNVEASETITAADYPID